LCIVKQILTGCAQVRGVDSLVIVPPPASEELILTRELSACAACPYLSLGDRRAHIIERSLGLKDVFHRRNTLARRFPRH
jgi:hypothetical protein